MAPALLAPLAPAAAALVAPRPRARGALVASPVGDWRPRSRSAWRAGDWRPAPVAPVAPWWRWRPAVAPRPAALVAPWWHARRPAPVCATFRRPVGDWRPGGPNGRDRPCSAPVAVAAEWRWRLRPAVASGPAAGGVAADGVAVALDGAPQWRPPGAVASRWHSHAVASAWRRGGVASRWRVAAAATWPIV